MMKKIFLSLAIAMCGHYTYAQTYLPLTAGSGNPLTGPLDLNSSTTHSEISVHNGDFLSIEAFNPANTIKKPVVILPYGGNVGIGTTNPLAKLVVSNGGAQNVELGYSSGISANYIESIDRNGGATPDMAYYLGGGNASQRFYTNANERLRINANGNVGIGTTTPSTSLDVAGVIQIAGVSSNTPPSGLSYGLFGYVGVGLGIFSGALSPNQGIGIWTAPGGVKTEVMRILSGGNVGIGTVQPDAKLTVNGTIHATEVKVTPTVPVPDYVFEPTYNPIDLSKLKAYLAANHHLPEIPSASEIEKNGLNLSEMNLKLLKKVEELTLYVIELKEENQTLKEAQKKIDEQEVRLQTIEKTLSNPSHN